LRSNADNRLENLAKTLILMQSDTILAAIQRHVQSNGNRHALTFIDSDESRQSLTFQQLATRVETLAAAFLRHANAGDRALLAYAPGLEFVHSLLACMLAGITAVPAFPPRRKPRGSERVLTIVRDCGPRLILCSSEKIRQITAALANPGR
jgi:acyl-CoA synthetase (AMP-forming)/AMP-acid ligase II